MTVDLLAIGLGLALAIVYPLVPGRRRGGFLYVVSLVALFWLQPPLPLRWAGFLLPVGTLVLTTAVWWLTRPPGQKRPTLADWRTLWLTAAAVLGLGLVRYLPPTWRPTLNRPPDLLLLVGILAVFTLAFWMWSRRSSRQSLAFGTVAVLFLFLVLKWEPLAAATAGLWRSFSGQKIALASSADLIWLGYSYIAFRLLHTIRDRQTGQLPGLSLEEYLGYVIYFPSLIAGPIARAENVGADWRKLPSHESLDAGRWGWGLWRIGTGAFKKFVLADGLALGLALTPVIAADVRSTAWLWLLLYGYALRLYLDFAGYSDIAIGLSALFGIRLPENFDRPYLQSDLGSFWKRWHISLSDWARFYIFSPLTRSLLRRKPRPPTFLIVANGHLATMLVIGLWHGLTLNFAIWGAWHGVGLFIHKQWSDRTRALYRRVQAVAWQARLWRAAGWFLTFHYVVLGWVWFLMPAPASAGRLLAKLMGGSW